MIWRGETRGGLTLKTVPLADGGPLEVAERTGAADAPTVVLLHGIGGGAETFDEVAALAPPDWRLVSWSAPGYGGSAPLAGSWPTAQDYADALARLLDALGIDRAMVLGHSLGALTAASFAARRPERVARLALASPALGHGAPPGGPLSAAGQARIDDLEALGPEAFAAARAPRLVHAPEAFPERVAVVRETMARVQLPGYAQAARMLASGRLLDDLARVSAPTDVIAGVEDRVTPIDGARRAYAALPPSSRGRFVEAAAVGHALAQEAPALLVQTLVDAAARLATPALDAKRSA